MLDVPFETRYDPASSVLAVRGTVDPDLADDLAEDLAAAVTGAVTGALTGADEEGPRLTVDLTEVTYLPSIGISVLVQGMRRAADVAVDVVLVAARGTAAERVLEITGVPHQVALDADDLLPGSSR